MNVSKTTFNVMNLIPYRHVSTLRVTIQNSKNMFIKTFK